MLPLPKNTFAKASSYPDSPVPFVKTKTYRIMPIGDSITRGVGDHHYRGYRMYLQKHLRAAGVRTNFVGSQSEGDPLSSIIKDKDHEGHGGFTIQELRDIIKPLVTSYHPDIVLLQAGTNDMLQNESPSTAHTRLDSLITDIQTAQPGVIIFVAKIPGLSDGATFQSRADTFNDNVAGLTGMNQVSKGVFLVDNSAIGKGSANYWNFYDAHHPNQYGYYKMAYNWYMRMRKIYSNDRWPKISNPSLWYNASACHNELNKNQPDGCWLYTRDYDSNGNIIWRRGKKIAPPS